mmetsp:Transcript_32983/g.80967  ORF Transcript_32983/g.80967 Transcript_32983/m.80967 type:complete len:315 (+) Transcript_32983:123-1067(+)
MSHENAPPHMLRTLSGQLRPEDEVLLEPFHYIGKLPGKGIRPRLIAAFNAWLQVPPEIIQVVSDITQKLHNASLMIDDIEDNSHLRRGTPVAHLVFGIPQTLNTANYVYFQALNEVNALGNPAAVEVFIREMLNLHRGQGLDIYWRDNCVCPTEDEYCRMVQQKTGGLFRLSVLLMQCFSPNKADFIPLVNDLGLYFQVLDDYLNLQSGVYHQNKSYCEDLTEGKYSFPIVHAVTNAQDNTIANILKQKPTDNDVKKFCVDEMEKIGSFSYTQTFLTGVFQRLEGHMQVLGDNPLLWALIDELAKSLDACHEAR